VFFACEQSFGESGHKDYRYVMFFENVVYCIDPRRMICKLDILENEARRIVFRHLNGLIAGRRICGYDVTEQSYHRWRKVYGGLQTNQVERKLNSKIVAEVLFELFLQYGPPECIRSATNLLRQKASWPAAVVPPYYEEIAA
jgi:hypothetical protein